METLHLIPWFDICISDMSDGNMSDSSVCPWIKRSIHQSHRTDIHIITEWNQDIPFTEVDWVYTKISWVTIGALYADCPIIVLIGEGECAVLHSGWRGTKAHIVSSGLALFETPREDIYAYIGPHISEDSYEVGREFMPHFPDRYFSASWDRIAFDIGQYIIDDLIGLSVERSHIIVHGGDTFSDPRYPSYRRDKTSLRSTVAVTRI